MDFKHAIIGEKIKVNVLSTNFGVTYGKGKEERIFYFYKYFLVDWFYYIWSVGNSR